jgi:RNA polymerase sigma-70 factor (ECF subfamily)
MHDEAQSAEFVLLLTQHQSDIYLYIRSLVLDPNEADEILQETNLVLWEKRSQFRVFTNFRAWAFQIARYKLLQRRAEQKRNFTFSDALVDQLISQATCYEESDNDLMDKLRHCVDKLAAEDREVIIRRYSTLAACEDIAKTIGRPVRSVYKTLSRIRQELFDCIAAQPSDRREQ